MRYHGRADISPTRPRALAICDKCGAMYNQDKLRWQFQWGGPRLINLRMLVCDTCYDIPQDQLRLLILPPDPVPISYPRPESYNVTDNPLSGIGFTGRDLFPGSSGALNIGNLTYFAGLDAAFDGNINKQSWRSAVISVSNSSYQNTVGKYWNAGMTSVTNPSSVIQAPLTYSVGSFSVYAPIDLPLSQAGATGVELQGSNDGVSWTILYSTTSAGTNGESVTSISSNITTGNYQYHRVAIQGDGINQISVSQVQFNVDNTGQNEQ